MRERRRRRARDRVLPVHVGSEADTLDVVQPRPCRSRTGRVRVPPRGARGCRRSDRARLRGRGGGDRGDRPFADARRRRRGGQASPSVRQRDRSRSQTGSRCRDDLRGEGTRRRLNRIRRHIDTRSSVNERRGLQRHGDGANPGGSHRWHLGRRHNPKWRRGYAGRQERQRVDVPLLVSHPSNSEMNVGPVDSELATRPDRANHVALDDRGAAADRARTEMGERHRPPVTALDRQRAPTPGYRPGEGHDTADRRAYLLGGSRSDIDAPMLTAAVRMGRVERERHEHVPSNRPRPGIRDRTESENGQERNDHEADQRGTHRRTPESRTALTVVCLVNVLTP